MKNYIRDEKLIKAVAKKLQAIRHERNMSQDYVSGKTNISIARIELAQVNITISTLSKLCDFYKISLTDFFDGL